MKRIVFASVALLVCAWWWFHPRNTRPNHADVTRSARVLADIARLRGGGIRWSPTEDLETVACWNYQHEPAAVEGSSYQVATIRTATWDLVVNLARIEDIVCDRQFHHVPEPGYVELKMSFRGEPEEEQDEWAPRELFGVRFDQERQAEFIALCDRHKLRKDGDWW